MVGMFLSVGAGGAIGAMARYGVGVLLAALFGASGWIATLANVAIQPDAPKSAANNTPTP